MGLDWLPGPKVRPGNEAEYAALKAALDRWFCWGRKSKQARLAELTVKSWETLGAPVVGRDASATEWARKNFENRSNRKLDLSGWLQQLDGLPVLELARPSDGLPEYTNGGPGEYLGEESFRAQFLKDCIDIIGDDFFQCRVCRDGAGRVRGFRRKARCQGSRFRGCEINRSVQSG
jgi:hypothetical protein